MPRSSTAHQMPAMRPEFVRTAATEWRRGRTHAPVSFGELERGDIRVASRVESHGDRRIVLVAAIYEDTGAATVVLAHSSPEMATSADAVIGPSMSGAPYPVVVQTDLVGCVWQSQLGRRVGCIDPTSVQAAVSSGNAVGEVIAGPPLSSVADPRWAFKSAEGRALRCLIANATAALLERPAG